MLESDPRFLVDINHEHLNIEHVDLKRPTPSGNCKEKKHVHDISLLHKNWVVDKRQEAFRRFLVYIPNTERVSSSPSKNFYTR